jgi:hypothetical protein
MRYVPDEQDAECLLQALNQGVALDMGVISPEQYALICSRAKQLELL